MGDGGGDLCLEHKVYSSLVPVGASPDPDTSFHGDTHAFGNTEEKLIRIVLGVEERAGDESWDARAGDGAVRAHRGAYADAIDNKGNTVVLFLLNVFGGFAPGAVAHLYDLSRRALKLDRTPYEIWSARDFVPYYTQRISAAVVSADARRCLRRLPGLQAQARDAAARAAQRRAAAPAAPH